MSEEVKSYLHNKGVATSRTTAYNPQGNGQIERYNGIIWKAITLALKSRNLPTSLWEVVLSDALHSIRSLLCTATNETPHERMFNYQRRSVNGHSIPSWLTASSKVLLKRHARQSKYEPLVDEVELLEVNPNYAHVRYENGRETTVALKHLTPVAELVPEENDSPANVEKQICSDSSKQNIQPSQEQLVQEQNPATEIEQMPRRSIRVSKPPSRLMYE